MAWGDWASLQADDQRFQDQLPGIGPQVGTVWQAKATDRLVVVDAIVNRTYSWALVHSLGQSHVRWEIAVGRLESFYQDTGKTAGDFTQHEGDRK